MSTVLTVTAIHMSFFSLPVEGSTLWLMLPRNMTAKMMII